MEPQKSKTEIIDETVEMIKSLGRALSEDKAMCMYRPEEHPGCAVGRCMIPSEYDEEMENENIKLVQQDFADGDIDNILLPEYRGHETEFWMHLQNLHDSSTYWTDDNQLTDNGYRKINDIKSKYV